MSFCVFSCIPLYKPPPLFYTGFHISCLSSAPQSLLRYHIPIKFSVNWNFSLTVGKLWRQVLRMHLSSKELVPTPWCLEISCALQCFLTTEEMYKSGQSCFENLFQQCTSHSVTGLASPTEVWYQSQGLLSGSCVFFGFRLTN